MTPADARRLLDLLARRWRRRRLVERTLLGASAVVAAVVVAVWAAWGPVQIAAECGLLLVAAVCAFRLRGKVDPIGVDAVAADLNRRYPQLQDSCQLVLVPDDELSELARLQQRRVLASLECQREVARLPRPRLPRVVGQPAFSAGTALITAALVTLCSRPFPAEIPPPDAGASHKVAGRADPRIASVQVTVTPPQYTGREPQVFHSLDVVAPRDALVRWRVQLTDPSADVRVVLREGPSLSLAPTGEHTYSGDGLASRPDFYRLEFESAGGTVSSPLARFDIVPDRPPVIRVLAPSERTEMDAGSLSPLAVEVEISDDYGVGSASLLATVATGQGEGVRFREQTLRFDATQQISSTKNRYATSLEPAALELRAGDELYFVVEAWDNCEPTAQHSRSEAFFWTIRDPDFPALAESVGIAVNPLPAYFRSQRQIIIDTEKLIREKGQLSEQALLRKCNDLGLDQKALRLRYGQFLGEEAESGVAMAADQLDRHAAELGETHQDHGALEKEVHHGPAPTDEDHGEHHDQQPAGAVDQGHSDHDHGPSEPGTNPLSVPQMYGHSHDSILNATFFSEDVKRQLKAVLAQMWDAELRLRTMRPEEALPYEYQALELLKQVQQASRIYVQRVGFDPPPLKVDEVRLSGDLSGIHDRTQSEQLPAGREQAEVRAALRVLRELPRRQELNRNVIRVLESAGEELARSAREDPRRGLQSLDALRAVIDSLAANEQPEPASITAVSEALWRCLRAPPPEPAVLPRDEEPLWREYLERLYEERP